MKYCRTCRKELSEHAKGDYCKTHIHIKCYWCSLAIEDKSINKIIRHSIGGKQVSIHADCLDSEAYMSWWWENELK